MTALARRSFLRLLGAAPIAARAAPAAIAQTAISPMGLGSIVPGVLVSGQAAPDEQATVAAAKWVLANGIPVWMRDEIRRERRVPQGLDPDLASNRSFSLSTKVRLQRDRDVDRAIEHTMTRQRTSIARELLRKTTGVSLWW